MFTGARKMYINSSVESCGELASMHAVECSGRLCRTKQYSKRSGLDVHQLCQRFHHRIPEIEEVLPIRKSTWWETLDHSYGDAQSIHLETNTSTLLGDVLEPLIAWIEAVCTRRRGRPALRAALARQADLRVHIVSIGNSSGGLSVTLYLRGLRHRTPVSAE